MSLLEKIQAALSSVNMTVEEGKYPENTTEPCGKVIFTGQDKPIHFMDGSEIVVETFRVVVRGNDYRTLEEKTDFVKTALKNAGFIQIGGYEDVEPKTGETFMQIAVKFKSIDR